MTELYQHTGKAPKITVLLDSSNEGIRKRFHCPVCGKVSFEYWGAIRGLVPGAPGIDNDSASGVVIHCKGRMPSYDVDPDTGDLTLNPNETKRECNAQFYI